MLFHILKIVQNKAPLAKKQPVLCIKDFYMKEISIRIKKILNFGIDNKMLCPIYFEDLN